MHFGELLIGIVLLAAGSFLFFIARARDGRARHFLRNDNVQAYFTIVIIGLLAVGGVNIITAIVPGESLGSFKASR